MQKWEYLYACITDNKLESIEAEGVGNGMDAEKAALRKKLGLGQGKISRAEFLKWCGQNGWEVAGFAMNSNSLQQYMIFKRPL